MCVHTKVGRINKLCSHPYQPVAKEEVIMLQLIIIFAVLTFLTLCYQGYRYAVTQTGVDRQNACQHHGIFFTSVGASAFLVPSVPVGFAGLVLIMLGLRLIAQGLDRIDKTIHIDRFVEDQTVPPLVTQSPEKTNGLAP
jgi:hypothetical protein